MNRYTAFGFLSGLAFSIHSAIAQQVPYAYESASILSSALARANQVVSQATANPRSQAEGILFELRMIQGHLNAQNYILAQPGTPVFGRCVAGIRPNGQIMGPAAYINSPSCRRLNSLNPNSPRQCEVVICPTGIQTNVESLAHTLIHELHHVINEKSLMASNPAIAMKNECRATYVSLMAHALSGASLPRPDGYVAPCGFQAFYQ